MSLAHELARRLIAAPAAGAVEAAFDAAKVAIVEEYLVPENVQTT